MTKNSLVKYIINWGMDGTAHFVPQVKYNIWRDDKEQCGHTKIFILYCSWKDNMLNTVNVPSFSNIIQTNRGRSAQVDTGNLLDVILVIELLLLYPSEIDKLISIFYSNIYIHYYRDNRLNTGYLWSNRYRNGETVNLFWTTLLTF